MEGFTIPPPAQDQWTDGAEEGGGGRVGRAL